MGEDFGYFDPTENLRPKQTTILEVGPRQLPSVDFFRQFPSAKVVFVSLEPAEFDYQTRVPVSNYVQANALDFLTSNDPAIPSDGFDFILVCNTLGPSGEELIARNLSKFVPLAYSRLKPGGELIFEETYGHVKPKEGGYITRIIDRLGFNAQFLTNPKYTLRKGNWGEGCFQIVVTK